jgi:hypothetical protein
MSEVIRIVSDSNDEVTVSVTIDGESHAAVSPQTVIDAGTLKNAIPGFSDFRLTFKSASWSVDKNVTLVFLDTSAVDSERILVFSENTSSSVAFLLPNDTPSPADGDIAYHTDNGTTHGYFLATFIKERGYDFTGKRYKKATQPNPYLTKS